MECVRVCEAKAIDHQHAAEDLEVKVGSIILATGFDLMDPLPHENLRLRHLPNVSPAWSSSA
jgi:heterodisulfide reductase subunit A2